MNAALQYAIPVLSLGLGLTGWWWLATRRNVVEAVFSSFKEAANAKTASPNTRASFKALRALLREYGVKALEDEFAADGLVKDGKLTTPTPGTIEDITPGSMVLPIVRVQGGVWFMGAGYGTSLRAESVLVIKDSNASHGANAEFDLGDDVEMVEHDADEDGAESD